jgi:hypothetical protein
MARHCSIGWDYGDGEAATVKTFAYDEGSIVRIEKLVSQPFGKARSDIVLAPTLGKPTLHSSR